MILVNVAHFTEILYGNSDQTLVKSLYGLLNFEIGGLECRVITADYISRVHYMHMFHLFCNALVHVIYSVVSGQYSYTIDRWYKTEFNISA